MIIILLKRIGKVVTIYIVLRVCFLVILLSTITVRVDPQIKRRMRRFSHINWSEVVRRAILERLEEEEKRSIAEALLINEKLRRRAPEGWSSVEVIKRWRRAR